MLLLVSGATATIREYADNPNMGHLITPGDGNMDSVFSTGLPVGADNECFNKLNKPAYVRMLRRIQGLGVLWCTAPDVVGNARATLLRFRMWAPVLEYYKLPIAFVAQDGQELLPVPWNRIHCLFIGGSTEWKLGYHAARLIREAKRRGKWVHIGRVNTQGRERTFDALGADSTDGSAYSRFSKTYIPSALARRELRQTGMEHLLCGD